MNTPRRTLVRDEGWTLIEATIAVVIMSIMLLGLTIVLLAFREQLDRSWAVRVMDQYGNDVIETLSHDLRNATDVSVRNGARNSSVIDITYLDPIRHSEFIIARWRAEFRGPRIERSERGQYLPVDPFFPPRELGVGESYEILEFTLNQYGTNTENQLERTDRSRRKQTFLDATWDIKFRLRYNRTAVPGIDPKRNWMVTKEYTNRVYVRNKNLAVQKGIID